jgi:hypothetical protein
MQCAALSCGGESCTRKQANWALRWQWPVRCNDLTHILTRVGLHLPC